MGLLDRPLWDRVELKWCWKCNQATEHRVSFHMGIGAGRYTVCKKCEDMVWDPPSLDAY